MNASPLPADARFYLDEDVPHACAALGPALGLDILPAGEAHPILPQDDPVHLRTAALGQRVMVTYNRDDCLAATRDAFATGRPHAGLLILTHRLPRDPARIVHALARWVERRTTTDGWPMQSYEVDFLTY